MYKQLLYQLIRFLIVVGTIISVYLFIKYTAVFLYPILLAVLFSLLINPFVTFLEIKLKFPRVIASLTVIMTIFSLIIGIIFFIITELIQGTAYLAEQIPTHFHTFITFVEGIINTKILPFYEKLISFFHTLDTSQQLTISENIKQFTNNVSSSGAELLQSMLLKIPNILTFLPSSMTIIIFIILATFLITNDWYALKQSLKKILPSSLNLSSQHVIVYLKKAFVGFFKAQLILISITAMIIFLGLLVLPVEHALTIALLAAVVDLLPYIGTGIIFIPWIIYLFITANYSMTISLTILYMFIVVLRQLLEPKILSSSIGLNPLAALITLFIGIQIWGMLGFIIAPILLVLFNALDQAGITKQVWLFIKG